MKLTYDSSVRIAGIGIVPWSRLGPERWLPNYKIASYYDWDITDERAPEVFALKTYYPNSRLDRLNSKALFGSQDFRKLHATKLPDCQLLTYKPVANVQGFTSLAYNQKLAARLENKAEFRELFKGLSIPFPAHRLYSGQEFRAAKLNDILHGRASVIVQDAKLSDGKGTFVVGDESARQVAIDAIEDMGGGQRLIVSTHVENAYERSVQCCVTRYGVFVGPLQAQVIADSLLANVNVPGSAKFCGAQITPHDPLVGVYPEIARYARKIGEQMQSLGYRGIFGLDCLVGRDGRVYVLEVNARLTGVTPLLTMLHREGQDIPFYLLHILELADLPYSIEDTFVDSVAPEGSLLVMHAQGAEKQRVRATLSSGLYNPDTLAFRRPQLGFEAADTPQLLLQQYIPPGVIKPGARVVTLFTNHELLDADGGLTAETRQMVQGIRSKIHTQPL